MAKHKRPRRPPAPRKPPLTHFLCLPLVTAASKPPLEQSIAKFKADVTLHSPSAEERVERTVEDVTSPEGVASSSIHPKAVRPVGALHCTLGVMSLEPDQLKAATELLEALDVQSLLSGSNATSTPYEAQQSMQPPSNEPASLRRSITPPLSKHSTRSMTVDLKGLESMHAPEKTSILYIEPSDASQRLYNFCLAMQKTFEDNGFLVEDSRALKLHATIVNTIYAKGRKRPVRGDARKEKSASSSAQQTKSDVAGHGTGEIKDDDRTQGHGPHANAPLKIDATQILEKYKDFTWAKDVVLDRVAICEMGAKKILDDAGNVRSEEYTEVASIALPV